MSTSTSSGTVKSKLTASHVGRVGDLSQDGFHDSNVAIEQALQRPKDNQRCKRGREAEAGDGNCESQRAKHQRRFAANPVGQSAPLQRCSRLGKVEE
jgi:hypothetical protein